MSLRHVILIEWAVCMGCCATNNSSMEVHRWHIAAALGTGAAAVTIVPEIALEPWWYLR